MAKYIEIGKQLKAQIMRGEYTSDAPLPDQVSLAKMFKTSRVTIQKALDLLINEGLIYSKQGSGTYVKQNINLLSKFDATVDQYVGTTELMRGHTVTSEVIDYDVRLPDAKEQENLNLTIADAVYDFVRLRIVDGTPWKIEHSIMPVKVVPGLNKGVLHHSIYHYMHEELGETIGAAYRIIRAAQPNAYDRRYLDAVSDTPMLEVEQIVSLADGTPFEYSFTRNRYDKGSIVVYHPERPML
ncbi:MULTISPECIES: GntR family transcriptional regulator [unclassified Lacticaseibacillus]|uniref:GntR family transcriptional regulator n=1 Tax=unclassified Lacticaseibacillus TaxID=2759744 RepID=UPI00194213D4|nr:MULTISPECIES: GntR family transcriptional regulator [unclassified Lacticaseibacillus]